MKKIRSVTALLTVLLGAFSTLAAIPAGYYDSLNGKSDAELKTAVYTIIHNFTQVSSYSALPTYFEKTDVYPQSRRWWDMYSDIPLYAPSFSGLNREHSFPKSWWGGSTSIPAYVDLNHLYPSEMKANTAKSNYPLGTVDPSLSANQIKFDNGMSKVGAPVGGQGGGASYVFEPDDEYKGDFARTYFYMVTCYQYEKWSYTYMLEQNTYPTLNGWSVNLLLDWHRKDPVSEKETMRNETVYGIQSNRNPFIDMPELAEYIWGTKKGEKFTPGTVVVPPTQEAELIAPSTGMSLQFGQVALGSSYTAKLFIKAIGVVNSIDVTIYKDDYKMFRSASNSIAASLVCSEDGYWLNVTYAPTETGQHTSRILLDWGNGSRAVELIGECLPVPTLTACTATAASSIESDRYTANWTYPTNEVIDYFMVTRTRYIGNNVYTEEIPAEDNFLEILGFENSDREAYSVQSVRLGYRSPMSNVVFVEKSGVEGVTVEEPLQIQAFGGMIRFICSAPQNNVRIFDISGRTIAEIDEVDNNFDIDLPRGVYIITTAQHPTPVVVRN